jgi:hypothetical protein
MAITKPRKNGKRGRQHVGSLIRTLSWEWLKFNHPKVAERIKAVAYEDCGLRPPKASTVDPHLRDLLKRV